MSLAPGDLVVIDGDYQGLVVDAYGDSVAVYAGGEVVHYLSRHVVKLDAGVNGDLLVSLVNDFFRYQATIRKNAERNIENILRENNACGSVWTAAQYAVAPFGMELKTERQYKVILLVDSSSPELTSVEIAEELSWWDRNKLTDAIQEIVPVDDWESEGRWLR